MNNPRGSVWGKWDLHVHTPNSIHNEYHGEKEDAWNRFLTDLEALPPEFKVIGINDYLFIDGYKRILEERANNRLQNIDLILPVIEMRLDKFGGTESDLSKVNFHIVFSDEIDPDIIEGQFINALYSSYSLTPQFESLKPDWAAVPTRDSLTDLGKLIIDSVPDEKKHQYGSPLVEGFNNITFKLDEIIKILQSSYFRGRCLTAVGKTEWWNIKWNDQSIAEKKNVINSVHFVFISSESVSDCKRAKESLTEAGVNNRLLDCSDAHHYSGAEHKDRIGKCFTWIKADPTFNGLSLALYEPEERISLGEKPQKLEVVKNNKTKYIRSIKINKIPNSTLEEVWYENIDLLFNHDMVAIIGNRGMGKSALSEVIGLLGNTRNDEYFSFLCPQRFRSPLNNKASHYEAELTWESGDNESANLAATCDHNTDEMVKYIPQGFFDEVCNEIVSGEETNFDKELKKVIFSHVDQPDRLGTSSLDDLIAFTTDQTYDSIRRIQSQIHEVNSRIIEFEAKLDPEYRLTLNSALAQKQREIEAHDATKPDEIVKPEIKLGEKMQELAAEIERIQEERKELNQQLAISRSREEEYAYVYSVAERVIEKVDNFFASYKLFETSLTEDLQKLGIIFNDVVKLNIDKSKVESAQSDAKDLRLQASLQTDVSVEDSIAAKMIALEVQLKELQAELDEPTRKFRESLEDIRSWEEKRVQIIGDENTIDSLEYIRKRISDLDSFPEKLNNSKRFRNELAGKIHDSISRLVAAYQELYEPVQQFIESYPVAKDVFQMEFGVSIINVDFHRRLFDWIGRNVVGSFYGSVEGEKQIIEIMELYDFNDQVAVLGFLDDVMEHLTHDLRDPRSPQPVNLSDQLRKERSVITLYDYMYSLEYLEPRFILKLGEKELSQLSPGERGILLLTFYLLVDKGNIPLVIDQPEENLDNQTLYEFLVSCIKDAKKRRQIIIVTHNPNLAVVCDAEQIICCSIDKVQDNRIEYQSGSIENPIINRKIIDILEGTQPAFDNRKLKYQPPIMGHQS